MLLSSSIPCFIFDLSEPLPLKTLSCGFKRIKEPVGSFFLFFLCLFYLVWLHKLVQPYNPEKILKSFLLSWYVESTHRRSVSTRTAVRKGRAEGNGLGKASAMWLQSCKTQIDEEHTSEVSLLEILVFVQFFKQQPDFSIWKIFVQCAEQPLLVCQPVPRLF